MATLNYYLDCRSKRNDGTSPLKMSVNTSQGNFLLSIGIYIEQTQWNAQQKMIVKHPQRVFLNSHLLNLKIQAEQALINEKQRLCHSMTKEQIKKVLLGIVKDGNSNDNSVESVFKRMMCDTRLRIRTRELYETTLKKINNFTGDKAQLLQFDDITVGWLQKFEKWLTNDCPSANARAIHLRNLRAVFNMAIDDELTTNYPFRKFKITKEATRKRALTVEQIHSLMTMKIKPSQKRYVDTFMLMIYLMGINAVDLLTAKPSQIVNGRLEYKRAKTKTLYSIKLEPEALEIIKRYKGKKYLLKFCDNVKNYKDFLKRMNICLGKLIDGCTTYYARHSVATIAAEIDIPLDTIARMLGHTDPARRITLVYVDFNQQKIDEANRKVIDYILKKKYSHKR